MFITLEGIDGSGKTSVAKMLKNYFEKKGSKVYLTEEPTKIIFDIKSLMERDLDVFTRTFLFMADRVEHIKVLKEEIENGNVVICDRYVDSTFAYQGSIIKNILGSKEKAFEYLNSLYEPFSFEPDRIIYLDVKPDLGLKRIESRKREIFEKVHYLENVRDFYLYLSMIRNYKIFDSNITLIDLWKKILMELNL
ncbi:MAG: dTMP kinase [Thermoplasmata archaeon]